MSDISNLPDWDALDEHQRQSLKGEVRVGRWLYPFHIHHDTDRLFLDLLADAPLSVWSTFLPTSDPNAFQTSISTFFGSLAKKPCASLDSIDWGALQTKVVKTATLITSRVGILTAQTDPFALYASAYHASPVSRPARLHAPSVDDLAV